MRHLSKFDLGNVSRGPVRLYRGDLVIFAVFAPAVGASKTYPAFGTLAMLAASEPTFQYLGSFGQFAPQRC
jgi:hypothetical protein